MRPDQLAESLRLYLVADRDSCGARGLLATVEDALPGGVTTVQLRDPRASARQLCREGEELRRLLLGTGVPLVVNDRVDVALAIGADGVHLGQSDLPPLAARELAGPDLILGWSVSSAAELAEALRLPEGTLSYLGLGPVWATPTKPDAAPALGVAGLAGLVAAAQGRLPLVAIGGIQPENCEAVVATGVDGIAVVSAICGAAEPRSAAERLLSARRPTQEG